MSRLEEIRERYMKWEYDFNLDQYDLDWLLEQAKRVRELEEENAGLHDILEQVEYQEKDKLLGENKRYREVIERAEKELLDKTRPLDFSVSTALDILIEALEGE